MSPSRSYRVCVPGELSVVLGLLLMAAEAGPSVPPTPTPAEYELRITAPPQCPAQAEIRARVLALLSGPPVGEGTMHVDVVIEPEGEGLTMRLTTAFAGQRGMRRLSAARCPTLTDTIALVVAVALEPGLEAPVPAEPTSVPAEPTSVPAAPTASVPIIEPEGDEPVTDPIEPLPPPPLPASTAAAPSAPPRRRWQPLARLSAGVEYGALAGVTGATQVAVGLAWTHVRAELRGSYLWPRRSTGPGDFSALSQLGAAGVVACARARLLRTELPLCGGLEGGAARVASRGVTPAETVTLPWLGPTLGTGVTRGGPRLRAWASGDVTVRVIGPEVLAGDRVAFRSRLVSLRLWAGIELVLP